MRLRIPAKINLHLEVAGRRPDGFHEVRTLLQSVDLYDELIVREDAPGILELDVEPAGAVTAGEDNLVLRAACALWRISGTRQGAGIRLRKRIPVGGGLGGGSADAAAALVLLDRFWSLGLGVDRLRSLAADLGSDVPFFLQGGLAVGRGRGGEVDPLPDLGPLSVVIGMPDVQAVTADVYGRIDERLTSPRPAANVYALAADGEVRPRWEVMVNDLQPLVVERWPAVGDALIDLEKTAPLRAGVSGAGAAVYAVYADRAAAERVGEIMAGRWRTHVGVTLGREHARPVVRSEGEGSWK
jgi:4-diphosphocytidyl-2-C-methyl-D-erythritol kinase